MQTVTASRRGAHVVWKGGKLSGDALLRAEVNVALSGDTSEWLPIGYMPSVESAHSVALAMRHALPDADVVEAPPLQWDDEVILD